MVNMAKAKAAKGRPKRRKADPHKVKPPPEYLDVPIDELADAVATGEGGAGPATKPLSLYPLSPDEALRRAMRLRRKS